VAWAWVPKDGTNKIRLNWCFCGIGIKGLKWDTMTRHINLDIKWQQRLSLLWTDTTVIISEDVIQNATDMVCTTFFIIKSAFT
jgi:hypothetical protein